MIKILAITKFVADYWRRDQNAKYGLAKTVSITITGVGAGIGNVDCGPLSIRSDPGGNECVLTCSPFDADDGLWNGPDVIPNERDDGSMVGSLWHDLIWGFAEDIAEQTGLSIADVKQWGNGILYTVWQSEARKNGQWNWWNRFVSWTAYHLTSWSKNWYGKVKG